MTTTRRSLPRWLQQWWVWFAVIFAVTFVSFWPSFFSAIVNIETHIIIHGVSAIAWMLLTIIQASLIKSGLRKHHRTVARYSTSSAVDDLHRDSPARSRIGADLSLWGALACAHFRVLSFQLLLSSVLCMFFWPRWIFYE